MRQPYSQPTLPRILGLGVGLFLLVMTNCTAQYNSRSEEIVFTIVEHSPEFSGGSDSLKRYLLKNVSYPPEAKKAGIKGRVFTSFIVETDGSITDVQLLRGLGYGCDDEAIRVVKTMPRWQPGTQSGRPVRVRYNLPVLFGVDYPSPGRR